MSDEIEETPAAGETNENTPPSFQAEPLATDRAWEDLSLEEKVDAIARQQYRMAKTLDWLAGTVHGIVQMAGNLKPADLFKMLKGGL